MGVPGPENVDAFLDPVIEMSLKCCGSVGYMKRTLSTAVIN